MKRQHQIGRAGRAAAIEKMFAVVNGGEKVVFSATAMFDRYFAQTDLQAASLNDAYLTAFVALGIQVQD